VYLEISKLHSQINKKTIYKIKGIARAKNTSFL